MNGDEDGDHPMGVPDAQNQHGNAGHGGHEQAQPQNMQTANPAGAQNNNNNPQSGAAHRDGGYNGPTLLAA